MVIRDINAAVENKTGRALLAEVRYVHPDGRTAPASLVARGLATSGASTVHNMDQDIGMRDAARAWQPEWDDAG